MSGRTGSTEAPVNARETENQPRVFAPIGGTDVPRPYGSFVWRRGLVTLRYWSRTGNGDRDRTRADAGWDAPVSNGSVVVSEEPTKTPFDQGVDWDVLVDHRSVP